MKGTPGVHEDERNPPSGQLSATAGSLFHLFPSWQFRLLGEVDSTNAEARRLSLLLGGEAWARVIMTDFQSAGRGRMSRTWQAPPGTSLLATIMVPTTVFRIPHSLIPLALACWLVEGLERLGAENIQVKWPNDVLLGGQKVAGLLCENSSAAAFLGLGVNLTQPREELPERAPSKPQATSLALELGELFPGRVAASVTLLGAILESIEHQPPAEWILAFYRERCASLGASIAFTDAKLGTLIGTAEELDPSGALVVNVEGHGRKLVHNALD